MSITGGVGEQIGLVTGGVVGSFGNAAGTWTDPGAAALPPAAPIHFGEQCGGVT